MGDSAWLRNGKRAVRFAAEGLRSVARPLEYRLLGRALVLAALVGVGAGLVGAAFAAALDAGFRLILEEMGGAQLLRAAGEEAPGATSTPPVLWLLALLPAAGGLLAGLIARAVPEVAGGGGDATVEAFHLGGARFRRRVLPAKFAASLASLATGGAGGREGPAMQLGASVGSLVAHLVPVNPRERRILFVAGIAAGLSSVFRTPLGAALLATEVLYRDDFESEALVPSVLASVVAFAVSSSMLGTRTLFGDLPDYRFSPLHLPLYVGLAVVAALGGAAFVGALDLVRAGARRSRLPRWASPAVGGLLVGAGLLVLHASGLAKVARVPATAAVLGGGYGLAQLAVIPQAGMAGWGAVAALALLAALRLLATSLTIGSGGSAGDFAPSLVLGALLGGAFGHAAAAMVGDPSIAPGAFAIVGMGAFYGAIAHVPLSALVLVSELAGDYHLLVPLMLATGAAHLALRRVRLYRSQEFTARRSAGAEGVSPGERLTVRQAMALAPRVLDAAAPAAAIRTLVQEAPEQQVIPVVDAAGRYVGLVGTPALLLLALEPRLPGLVAVDLAGPPVALEPDDTLDSAADRMADAGVAQIPVCQDGQVIGLVGQADVVRARRGGAG
jgi:CIC family chloride channel protein